MDRLTRRQLLGLIGPGVGVLSAGSIAPNAKSVSAVPEGDRHHLWRMTQPTVTIERNDDNGTVRASGVDDEIKDTDAATVIQRAIDSLPEDSWNRSVGVNGSFDISSSINLANRMALDLTNSTLTATGDHHLLDITDASDVTITGGVLDGEGQPDGEHYLGVIVTNRTERLSLIGTQVRNGGYYGVSLFEANDCLLWGVRAHDNYRHGFHPGTNTEGWGWNNQHVYCIAENNGVDGINDRGGGSSHQALHNQYVNCIAQNNGQNGIHLSDEPSSDTDEIGTYHLVGCQSFDNEERGFRIGSASASMICPVADGNQIGVLVDGSEHVSIVNPHITNYDQSDAIGIEFTNLNSNLANHVLVSGGLVHTEGENLSIDIDGGGEGITIRDVYTDGGGAAVEHPGNMWGLTMRNVEGYATEDSGRQYQSGTGDTTRFDWSHDLAERPNSLSVTPGTEDALGEFYANADESNVEVIYEDPPPEGTDNLKWWWEASIY